MEPKLTEIILLRGPHAVPEGEMNMSIPKDPCDECDQLEQEDRSAARMAQEAAELASGPQPTQPNRQQEWGLALRERIAAHERLTKHRAEHGS